MPPLPYRLQPLPHDLLQQVTHIEQEHQEAKGEPDRQCHQCNPYEGGASTPMMLGACEACEGATRSWAGVVAMGGITLECGRTG